VHKNPKIDKKYFTRKEEFLNKYRKANLEDCIVFRKLD